MTRGVLDDVAGDDEVKAAGRERQLLGAAHEPDTLDSCLGEALLG